MATDIAFALGALALLGRRVPPGLRLMLLTLAVADDIGSVLVLALFYSSRIYLPALLGAAVVTAGMVLIRRQGHPAAWPYLVGGVALWGVSGRRRGRAGIGRGAGWRPHPRSTLPVAA